MRLIRAGIVIATDETAHVEEDFSVPLTPAQHRSLAIASAGARRQEKALADIELATSRRATFKHTEPKSIYSPSGRVLNQFEQPKCKPSIKRTPYWAAR